MGVGGGRVLVTEYVVPARLPVTTEEIVSHNQDNVKLRRWGPRQCELRQLVYFALNSSAEQSHKDSPRKSSWTRVSSKTTQPYESQAPPPCSWYLLGSANCGFLYGMSMSFYLLVNAAVSIPDFVIFAGSCPCPFYLLVKAIFQPCFWVIPFQAPRV